MEPQLSQESQEPIVDQELTEQERIWQAKAERLKEALQLLDEPWRLIAGAKLADANFADNVEAYGLATVEEADVFWSEAMIDLANDTQLREALSLSQESEQVSDQLLSLFNDETIRPDLKTAWLATLME